MKLLNRIMDGLCGTICNGCGRIFKDSEARNWPTAVYAPGIENEICPDCYRKWKAKRDGQKAAA